MDDDSPTLEKGVVNITTVSSGTVRQFALMLSLLYLIIVYMHLFTGSAVSSGLWTMCLQPTKSTELR